MPACEKCGHEVSRRPRSLPLKLVSRASFACENCGARSNFYRPFVAIFQPWCQCPLCHNRRLTVLRRADRVDRMSSNALRRLLFLLGFPLYHCTFCRYQFRDWRKLSPRL